MTVTAAKRQKSAFMRIAYHVPNIMLVGLLALVVYSVLGVLLEHKTDAVYPKALGGKIDLSRVDFDQADTIPLEGKWEFYWQSLFTPQQLKTGKQKVEYVKVPHVWMDMPEKDGQIRQYGFATYKLSVTVPNDISKLALTVPAIGSSYRIYINQQLLSEAGHVSDTEASAEPLYKHGIFTFSVPENSFDIVVQVSNYDLIWGGIWEDLRIGTPENSHLKQGIKNTRSVFLIGIFLTIAAFNMIQFSLRTMDSTPLVIASICVLLACREVERSAILAFMELYYLSYFSSISISFVTFYLTTAGFIVYYYLSFPQEYNRKIAFFLIGISLLFSVSVFITPTTFFTQMTVYFQIMCIGVVIFMVYGVTLATIRKKPNASIVMLGTMILCVLLINDILVNLRIIDSINLISFGLVGLIMCQNYATYSRFISATEQNEFLSQELSERNTELETFSKSLEQTVEKRTEDLSKANDQLEILAYHDSLTAVLNRRGLLQQVDSAKSLFEKDNIPFCFLLIDFDHFKKLNDSLGHDAGDQVLVVGAKNIASALHGNDKIGRWGGEEFLILLNNTSLQQAKDKAEGVRVVIDEIMSSKMGVRVTISIGVSQFIAGESIEKAINRADEALYEAKANGRNRVELSHK